MPSATDTSTSPIGLPHNTPAGITINSANSPADISTAAKLIRAYAEWLDLDLTFQNFSDELAFLPGRYSHERGGCLLLARDEGSGEALGVVAMRALELPPSFSLDHRQQQHQQQPRKTCELKRLYTTASARGKGVGLALVQEALARAREMGHAVVLLDTLPVMRSARRLYEGVGFVECGAYYDTPIEGTVFMRLEM